MPGKSERRRNTWRRRLNGEITRTNMKNLVIDGVRCASFLLALTGMAACSGAGNAQSSEPAKTASPAASGAAAPAGSASNGAPGKEEIRTVLKDHSRDLKVCSDKDRDRGMIYKGDTKFLVKIAPDGKVSDVKGLDVTAENDFLVSCISESMKSWTFPASGKVSNVTIPINW
jgi:hypothetical protein